MGASLPRTLLGIAAPPRCGACGRSCAGRSLICERCAGELLAVEPVLEPGPPGVDRCLAASSFEGVARDLVHGLKFGRRLGLACIAADAIANVWPHGPAAGTLVPVPAAELRRRWRGFDPAEEIAIALARGQGLELARCLRRRHGPRQVGRRRSERLADPPRVALRRPAPETALLVDDVLTTGATLSACAAALRSGGTRHVVALVLARKL